MEITAPQTNNRSWNAITKFFFRFFCLFFFVTNFGSVLYWINLGEYYQTIIEPPVLWFAKDIMGITYDFPSQFNGSGDRTFDYALLLLNFLIAFLGALIWSIFDFRRDHYEKGYYWLRTFVRYVLAFSMMGYGFAKIFYLQMPFPSLFRLLEPYGDSSPMGLAWTFIGYSKSYSIFSGMAELIGGLLLLSRRTTALGALLLLGVVGNITMMNFCYDIPVKLYTMQLMVMILFLLIPDIHRLWKVFFLNRATEPVDQSAPFDRSSQRWLFLGIKLLVVGAMLYTTASSNMEAQETYGEYRAKPALYGIWNVDEFVINNDTLPPLLTDTVRWQRLLFDRVGTTTMMDMDDKAVYYASQIDTSAQTLTINKYGDEDTKFNFSYDRPDPDRLLMEGVFDGDSLSIKLLRYDLQQFKLVSRGFNWINERPYNR